MLARRERLLQWITQLDGQQGLVRLGKDGWAAFQMLRKRGRLATRMFSEEELP
jgi:hypothetical protein